MAPYGADCELFSNATQAVISAHCSSLSMLLLTANLNVAQLNAKKLREEHMATDELWRDDAQKKNSLLEDLQSGVDKNTEVITSHTKLIKDVMKLDWLQNLASDLKQLARKIFWINIATFRMMVEIRASLPSHLDRCLIQEPFLLEDAIGREAPVHLQFISSWDAFYAVLEARFQGLQGYNKIKMKEFVLQERATRRDISRAGTWEGTFLPGQSVDMSIIFTELRQNVQHSCPRCQVVNVDCSRKSTQCAACGMWFTRVMELCDSDPPGTLNLLSRTVHTATGIKVNTPISRVKRSTLSHGPFENPVHGPESHLQPEGSSLLNKHSLEEVQEEIGRFKRVRMIYQQFREKNGHSKTDTVSLSRRAANQQPNNDDSNLTKDPRIAPSTTPNSPSSSAPLPRQGHSNSDAEGIVAGDETSSHSSMDVNWGDVHVHNHVNENGRRYYPYQAGSKTVPIVDETFCGSVPVYLMPNDEQEQDRMDMQHHTIGLVLDHKLFLAPVQNPKTILEQGTGTGIWTIQVADKYKDATVIGTDLSAIQPNMVPPNCQFEIDDMTLCWQRDADSFDFVFSRFGHGFTEKNWDKYLSESFNCLAPGGWAEIQDIDFVALSDDSSLPRDSAIKEWHRLICEGAAYANVNMRISSIALKTKFENAGFTNIKVVNKKIPMGRWPKDQKLKEIGIWQREVFLSGLEAFSLAIFSRYLGWSSTELRLFLVQVCNEVIRNEDFHWYWPFFVVYGQKPVNKRECE